LKVETKPHTISHLEKASFPSQPEKKMVLLRHAIVTTLVAILIGFKLGRNYSSLFLFATQKTTTDDDLLALSSLLEERRHQFPSQWQECDTEDNQAAKAVEQKELSQKSSENKSNLYHESLVHPATLSHPNPKRIALLCSTGRSVCGNSVKEVLKHNTVETVIVLQVDSVANANATSAFDDSSIMMDDSRVVIYSHEKAIMWFVDNHASPEKAFFDVIILDEL
jgi:spermidine synthase